MEFIVRLSQAENKMPLAARQQLRCGTAAALVSAKAPSIIFPSQV